MNHLIMRSLRGSAALFFLILFLTARVCVGADESSIISVDAADDGRRLNSAIFGVNLVAYDPSTYENWGKDFKGYSDYGAGIWDPKKNVPVDAVIELLKDAGITYLRFPGGCGVHHYNWKDAVGVGRPSFQFGLDEFMRVCKAVSAKPILTLNFLSDTPESIAEEIEYLNAPNNGSNWGGGIDWAAQRAANGHAEPYGIQYVEVGNEEYHGDHKTIKRVSAEDYANKYLKFFNAIKIVDPAVKVGAVLSNSEWNESVMRLIKSSLDFGIVHTYPSPGVNTRELMKMSAKDIYGSSLAVPVIRDEYNFKEVLSLMRSSAGTAIPIAVTEYNGSFVQDKPVPYRHALGTALINAEMIRVMMKPEHNILLANYWEFNNEYWGMVSNGFKDDPRGLLEPYFKRPNYYVYDLYHKHFGELLIRVDVHSESYDASAYQPIKTMITKVKTGTVIKSNLLDKDWAIKAFSGAEASEDSGILEIWFQKPTEFNYYHATKSTSVEAGSYYKMSGYIKTAGLQDDQGVRLEIQDGRGWAATRSSASSASFSGTTDWRYVEVVYQALPDAKAVSVFARRVGESGPLEGKAYFKDVRLEKFIPSIDTKIPYLSVNASKSEDGSRVYLMVINKNMDSPMTSTINLNGFVPTGDGNSWTLNGPSVDSTNEIDHNTVGVTHRTFEIKGNPFEYTFEPHSLTAIEIKKAA